MNLQKLLKKLARGDLNNIAFSDLRRLVEAFGFELARVRGSHHVFTHVAVSELVNLQDVKGQAKPYQIRQLLRLVERYNLSLEDRR
jgi:predicted RNA binding protein YcfA (HicA-like mRNA interferase family)